MEVVASLSQGRTAAAQCGLFTYKSVPVIFEPPCSSRPPNTRKSTDVDKLHSSDKINIPVASTGPMLIHKSNLKDTA